jgi:DNA repair photolyase
MQDSIRFIEAKKILSKLRGTDKMFGLTYNMNLYRGCQHGCIYCDTRSECYQVGDISKISVKANALDLLAKELKSKRVKGTVGTGSMNDPYMPIEADMQMTRKALEILADTKFPVHIITKSNLVMRDYDILQEIRRTYAAVSITITSADDKLSKILEPHAPSTSERLEAVRFLAGKGIYTGITLMPLLPGINDTKENVASIIQKTKDAGGEYIIPMFGVTLRKGSRDYFYHALDKSFPGMKEQYENRFGEQYMCNSPNYKQLEEVFYEEINKVRISSGVQFYQPPAEQQLSLF